MEENREEAAGPKCRLCLRIDPDSRDIFEDDLLRKISALVEHVKIKKNDGLPKTVCKKCFNLVQNFYEFKCQVEKSDRYLHQVVPKKQSERSWPIVLIKKFDENVNEIGKENKNLKKESSVAKKYNASEYSERSDNEKPLMLRTKRHKCYYCIKSFANLSLLEKHAVVHKKQPETVYICYLCDEKFYTADKVKNHAVEVHGFDNSAGKNFESEQISKSNLDKNTSDLEDTSENSNDKKSSKYSCKFCGRSFVYYKSFLAHLENHPDDYNKLFSDLSKSPKIVETAARVLNLNNLKNVQSKPVNDQSNISTLNVETNFLEKTSLEDYNAVLSYENKNEIIGAADEINTNFSESVNKFLLEEIGPVNVFCNDCGSEFSSRKDLKKHLLVHLSLQCLVCEENFPNSEELHKHQKSNHIELCTQSDSSNKISEKMKKKIKRQLRPHKCTLCKKAFAEYQSLENHLERHKRASEFPKRYLCEICSKIFAQSGSLKIHMRIHTGIKPYVCNICSRAFTKRTYLQLHFRIHSGEKPYSCKLCNKAFARANTLARHMTVHTGEAKYQCKICFKYFRRLTSLNEHTYTHTGQRPYACKTCSKSYNNAGSLYAHAKKCKARYENAGNLPVPTPEPLQPIENSMLAQDDFFIHDSSSQILIFSGDAAADEMITDQVAELESSCQYTIANLQNYTEPFPIQESELFNILKVI